MKDTRLFIFFLLFFLCLLILFFHWQINSLPSQKTPSKYPDLTPVKEFTKPKEYDLVLLDFDPLRVERAVNGAYPLSFEGEKVDFDVLEFEINEQIDQKMIRDMMDLVEAQKYLQLLTDAFKDKFAGIFNMSSQLHSCNDACAKIKDEVLEDLKRLEALKEDSWQKEKELNDEFTKLQRLNDDLGAIEREFNKRRDESDKEIAATDQRIARIDQIKDDLRLKIADLEQQIKKDKGSLEELNKAIQNLNSVRNTKQEELDDLKKQAYNIQVEIRGSQQLNLVCIQENIIREYVQSLMPNKTIDKLEPEFEKYSHLEGKRAEFERETQKFLEIYRGYDEQIKKFHSQSECDQSIVLLKKQEEDLDSKKAQIERLESDIFDIAKERENATNEVKLTERRLEKNGRNLEPLNQEFLDKDGIWTELEKEKERLRKKKKEECDPIADTRNQKLKEKERLSEEFKRKKLESEWAKNTETLFMERISLENKAKINHVCFRCNDLRKKYEEQVAVHEMEVGRIHAMREKVEEAKKRIGGHMENIKNTMKSR